MPRYEEAKVLVPVGIDHHGRKAFLDPGAALAWQTMKDHAGKQNLTLLLISAYRSVAYQEGIIQRKLARGLLLEQILQINAYPGYSEHHTGRAIDLGSPESFNLEENFERTPQFAWLCGNAGRFGFRLSFPRDNPAGLAYEPWHWCWQSVDLR
jgi:D-alanyl-D-alanine carboxypeptidase